MPVDPLRLDHEIRLAARELGRFRRALAVAPEALRPFELSARLRDPELRDGLRSSGDPLSPALLAWIERLDEQSRLAPFSLCVARAYASEPRLLDAPTAGRFTLRELLARALAEPQARRPWLDAYLAQGGALREQIRRFWDEREKLDENRALEDSGEPCSQALGWLAQTSDMFADLGLGDVPRLLDAALGPEVSEGWPSRLTARALGELLREARWFDGLTLDPEPLPRALSASSFLRGLAIVGRAWAEACTGGEALFSLAREPAARAENAYAALFAALPLSPAFARRRLGLGATRLRDHLRGVARIALLETRARALRVLLHGPALRGGQAFQDAFLEQAVRAFGFEPPPAAAGLLWRLRDDDAARFSALFWAARRADELVHEHDEDWFRNPRAVEELRAEARRPAIDDTAAAVEAGRDVLLKTLSEALG
jgi:hypothetical protein